MASGCLVKGPQDLGFTVVPEGPAWHYETLQTGDVRDHNNDRCLLGSSHQEAVSLLQAIPPGGEVHLGVSKGYSLPFDPDDLNNHIMTPSAIELPNGLSNESTRSAKSMPDLTIVKVIEILDKERCKGLQKGDVLVEINACRVEGMKDTQVGHIFQKCPVGKAAHILLHRYSPQDPTRQCSFGANPPANNQFPQSSHNVYQKPELLSLDIVKGSKGFGFSIADSIYAGQQLCSFGANPPASNQFPQSSHNVYQKPELMSLDIVKGSKGFGFSIADSTYNGKQIKDRWIRSDKMAPARSESRRLQSNLDSSGHSVGADSLTDLTCFPNVWRNKHAPSMRTTSSAALDKSSINQSWLATSLGHSLSGSSSRYAGLRRRFVTKA